MNSKYHLIVNLNDHWLSDLLNCLLKSVDAIEDSFVLCLSIEKVKEAF